MCVEVAIALASLAFTAYGTIQSQAASNRAASAQRQADMVKQAREKRLAIRDALIKRGQVEQSGANQGASSTSAVAGGAGSATTQGNSITGFLDQVGSLNQRAQKNTQTSEKWKSYASISASIFDATGGFKTVFDDLGGSSPKAGAAASGIGGGIGFGAV